MSDCLLAATTPYAVRVTARLAAALHLLSYRHFCKALKHPARANQTIGSITAREVVLNDSSASLPQGYVEHQVALLKHLLEKENREPRPDATAKTVILIHERIEVSDQIAAAVEELR